MRGINDSSAKVSTREASASLRVFMFIGLSKTAQEHRFRATSEQSRIALLPPLGRPCIRRGAIFFQLEVYAQEVLREIDCDDHKTSAQSSSAAAQVHKPKIQQCHNPGLLPELFERP
jgi:hypothetical protein